MASPSPLVVFVLGQLSIIVLVVLLVVTFWLKIPSSSKSGVAPSARSRESVSYFGPLNITNSQPETCAWLNVLLRRIYVELHHAGLKAYILQALVDALNSDRFPNFLGTTTITDLHLGDNIPAIISANVVAGGSQNSPTMDIVLDVEYSNDCGLRFAMDTEVLINYPSPGVAALPISLSVSITYITARVRIRCPVDPQGMVWLGLDYPPDIRCQVGTVFGASSQCVDPPKLEEVLVYQIQCALARYLVSSHGIKVPLPIHLFTPLKETDTTTNGFSFHTSNVTDNYSDAQHAMDELIPDAKPDPSVVTQKYSEIRHRTQATNTTRNTKKASPNG